MQTVTGLNDNFWELVQGIGEKRQIFGYSFILIFNGREYWPVDFYRYGCKPLYCLGIIDGSKIQVMDVSMVDTVGSE
ncbi:hypothetical protein KUTeg_007075 [Tegillarca granosa]|uniref:Uncharacterized protein n=1 Tax=Tegillarca granosa TaxID=220873 RepID=A0ABQ9FGW9_TEGGR|nr:hypothetical protein KUTeg_007075 [Tegillarca granosa]